MKLNRRERSALIVLLVALAALAVDKLIVPHPSAADAGNANPSDVAVGDALLSTFEKAGWASWEVGTWERGNGSGVADVPTFAPSDVPTFSVPDVFNWQRLAGRAGGSPQAGLPWDNGAQAVAPAAAFIERHTLQATLLGPAPLALVDGRAYRVGESVDGFVVRAVYAGEAEFVSDADVVVLEVPRPWRSARKPGP